jgi:hypothetical protein
LKYRITGGTDSGFHYWKGYGECPRRATLNVLARADEVAGESDVFGIAVGTYSHAFMDLYYTLGRQFDASTVDFDPPPSQAVWDEACRLYEWYSDRFPAWELGRVVATERGFPFEGDDAQRIAIEHAIGIAPFTFKPDLEVELDEVAAVHLGTSRNFDIEPGKYLVDHKFYQSQKQTLAAAMLNSLQFTAYQVARNAALPNDPVRGLIANVVIKTKEPRNVCFVVPPPKRRDVDALREALSFWKWIRDNRPDTPNPQEEYCFGFKPCKWWTETVCDRTAMTAPLVKLMGREAIA